MGRAGRCRTYLSDKQIVFREPTKDRPVLYRHLTGWFEKHHKYLYSRVAQFAKVHCEYTNTNYSNQIHGSLLHSRKQLFCEGARIIHVRFPVSFITFLVHLSSSKQREVKTKFGKSRIYLKSWPPAPPPPPHVKSSTPAQHFRKAQTHCSGVAYL